MIAIFVWPLQHLPLHFISTNYIYMKHTIKKLTSFADHLNKQYGKRGTKKREKYESGFELFKLSAVPQELSREKE